MAYGDDMSQGKSQTGGAGVESGLSSKSGFSGESEKSLGMDNKGPGQVPLSTPKKSSSKNGKKFNTC